MTVFSSVLSDIGKALSKVFKVGTTAATVAEPIIDIAFPGVANLYNLTVAEVIKVEGAAAAAGAQTGTGVQKLALVVAAIEDEYNSYLKSVDITTPALVADIEKYVNGVVASLNALPASVTA